MPRQSCPASCRAGCCRSCRCTTQRSRCAPATCPATSALLGADFFDALELPDGTVATLLGDVAGHGPAEAAVGVALRAAWRALILTGHELGQVLDGLQEVLVRDRP